MLSFTDVLKKADIDPRKVMMIRHALKDKVFKDCHDVGKVYEYTCHQRADFAKGYEYWAVFISDGGTAAKLFALYRVGASKPDTKSRIPKGLPESEAAKYKGEHAVYDLEHINDLSEYENRLVIEWGGATRSWFQKATNEKEIINFRSIRSFPGYEQVRLSYDGLKDILCDSEAYDDWKTALSSVFAIYLISDMENGKHYVGSAYNIENGLFGRWSSYIKSKHGDNKRMKELLAKYPERYHKFQFSILQILPKSLSNKEVIEIENLYKKKLLSIEFGMNEN